MAYRDPFTGKPPVEPPEYEGGNGAAWCTIFAVLAIAMILLIVIVVTTK